MKLYKSALAGLAMAATIFSASAQQNYTETLTVGTYNTELSQYTETIMPDSKKYLPVNVSFSNPEIKALQYDIIHTPEIKLTKRYSKNPDMMPQSDQVIITPVVETLASGLVVSRVMIVASKSEPFKMSEGLLMQLEVEALPGAFNVYPKQEMEINNIVMTAGSGTGFYAEPSNSYLLLGVDKLSLSCPDENLEIMPGGECTVTVAMENSVAVAGLELSINLPEGFTLKGLYDDQCITFLDRAEGCDQRMFDRGNGEFHLLAFRYDGENMTDTHSGDLFQFTVVAPETLTGDSFEIELNKFVISFGKLSNTLSYEGKGCTISIANGEALAAANKAAFEADLKTIEGLQADLDAAVKEILEKTPDYDVKPSQDAIQALIDAQKKQAEDAIAAVENAGKYENTVDSEAITAAIAKMKEDAATSGVDAITIENLENVKIYTPMGTRVAKPVRNAINIVVLQDGSAKKVFIK